VDVGAYDGCRDDGTMGRWGYQPDVGRGFMLVGALIPLFFVLLIMVGLYLWLTSRREPVEEVRSITILNERYAKGELTRDQYLEKKDQLTKK
jgi:uncharacterized membrane protein